MTKSNEIRSFMIVAGEASGDEHAAKLVRALREIEPNIEFFGAAGPKMRTAGVETIINADEFAVVGIPEIAKLMPMFVSAFRKLRRAAKERRPDAAILVDLPEFNLKLARSLKRAGVKVIYYISPQLWAWRTYRARTIEKHVDLLLTILPFEKDWYEARGIRNVEYVGSPLANEVFATISKSEFREKYNIGNEARLIALLPGSRRTEITRILPVMLDAAVKIQETEPETRFVVALSENRTLGEVGSIMGMLSKQPANLVIVHGETFDAVNAADAAAVCSGTATLETGIIGTPMVVVYKGSSLNYKILRPLISVEHFGLINLIAGERVATELIQADLTETSLAEELGRILEPVLNTKLRKKLKDAASKLGTGGASKRAARAIIREIGTD